MIALLVAVLVAGDIPPATPPAIPDEGIELPVRCAANVCVMPRDVVSRMVEAHNGHVDDIAALKRELAKLREIKGCAKLEVVPKQPSPGYKKERDL